MAGRLDRNISSTPGACLERDDTPEAVGRCEDGGPGSRCGAAASWVRATCGCEGLAGLELGCREAAAAAADALALLYSSGMLPAPLSLN